MSFAKRFRGNYCIYWAVLEHDGFLVLPVPRWFKRHTWKRFVPIEGQQTATNNGSRGLVYTKHRVEQRNFYTYLNSVVIERVTQYLTDKGLKDFDLRSSRG